MHLEYSPGYEYTMDSPQLKWHEAGSSTFQTCLVGGQKMMAIKTDDNINEWELHYLSYMTKGFNNMDDAKSSATVFAKKVLTHIASSVDQAT